MESCVHFGVCGGCSHQDTAYLEQLKNKEQLIRVALNHIKVENFEPIVPSPEIYFYRNKMEYSFGDMRDVEILSQPRRKKGQPLHFTFSKDENRVHVGLHPKRRFNLVTPTPNCLLQSKESQTILQIVCDWATDKNVPSFTRHNGEGVLRHLVIREGKNTNERMVNLVAKSELKEIDSLKERLNNSGVSISTFLWTKHDGLSDVTHAGEVTTYWGEGQISEKMNNVTLTLPPSSFMQTNTHAFEQMLQVLSGWVKGSGLVKTRPDPFTLLDLYCGSGAIGLNLLPYYQQLIGIEMDGRAIQEAKNNAEANRLTNCEFIEGRVEKVIPDLMKKLEATSTQVVVDPPRPGLFPAVIETLNSHSFPIIFYVSCSPPSLARDLAALQENYIVEQVQPFDFFPHTDHVETLVKLTRKS